MRTTLALMLALLICGASNANAQTKPDGAVKLCGWFDNPTPGNATLTDRDDEWTISMQGGHVAEGDWPTFTAKQWVRTGSSYGYGCACMVVIADRETHEINRIVSSYAQALSVCRKDRSLHEPAGS